MVRLGEESLDQILVWDIFWLKLVFPIRVSNYLGIIGNPILFKKSPAEVKKNNRQDVAGRVVHWGEMLQGGLSRSGLTKGRDVAGQDVGGEMSWGDLS